MHIVFNFADRKPWPVLNSSRHQDVVVNRPRASSFLPVPAESLHTYGGGRSADTAAQQAETARPIKYVVTTSSMFPVMCYLDAYNGVLYLDLLLVSNTVRSRLVLTYSINDIVWREEELIPTITTRLPPETISYCRTHRTSDPSTPHSRLYDALHKAVHTPSHPAIAAADASLECELSHSMGELPRKCDRRGVGKYRVSG